MIDLWKNPKNAYGKDSYEVRCMRAFNIFKGWQKIAVICFIILITSIGLGVWSSVAAIHLLTDFMVATGIISGLIWVMSCLAFYMYHDDQESIIEKGRELVNENKRISRKERKLLESDARIKALEERLGINNEGELVENAKGYRRSRSIIEY